MHDQVEGCFRAERFPEPVVSPEQNLGSARGQCGFKYKVQCVYQEKQEGQIRFYTYVVRQ